MALSANAPKYEGLTGTDCADISEAFYRLRYPFFLEKLHPRICYADLIGQQNRIGSLLFPRMRYLGA